MKAVLTSKPLEKSNGTAETDSLFLTILCNQLDKRVGTYDLKLFLLENDCRFMFIFVQLVLLMLSSLMHLSHKYLVKLTALLRLQGPRQ